MQYSNIRASIVQIPLVVKKKIIYLFSTSTANMQHNALHDSYVENNIYKIKKKKKKIKGDSVNTSDRIHN